MRAGSILVELAINGFVLHDDGVLSAEDLQQQLVQQGGDKSSRLYSGRVTRHAMVVVAKQQLENVQQQETAADVQIATKCYGHEMLSNGTPVVYTSTDGRRFAAHVIEVAAVRGGQHKIMVSRTGEHKNVGKADLRIAALTLKRGVRKLDFATLEGLMSSVGLEHHLQTVMTELTDDVLDLCEALVDDYDLMIQDLLSIHNMSTHEQLTLTGALQHAMAAAYKSLKSASTKNYSAQEHVAASLITRFIRYAAFMVRDGSNTMLAKSTILTAKRWQDVKLHASAERITRFMRFVVAVKRGDNVLIARTFGMNKKESGKRERRRKKSMNKSVKVRRKSMYEGDVVMEGILSKRGSGTMKRSEHSLQPK
jgi:hypothetical protein